MARFRRLFQDIRQTSAHLFTKKHPRWPLEEPLLEPPHTSPTSYQQIHASPTIECWNPVENRSLRVMNPDGGPSPSRSPAPSLTPSPPSRSPPPPPSSPPSPPTLPPSLHELFDGDDITPESFELQVTDEQEDTEPEEALFTYSPRPSSRLELRLEELSTLDGSLFPPVITFQDSPFPIFTTREANATEDRPIPHKTLAASQTPEIFPTPPLEQRLTRMRRRAVQTIRSTKQRENATNPVQERQLTRMPRYSKPLPLIPRDETEIIMQRIFKPAAEGARRKSELESTIDVMLATLDSRKREPAGLDRPTGLLDYNPPTPPLWHAYLTPSSAHAPSSLILELAQFHSSWRLPALSAQESTPIGASNYVAIQRESRRWQGRNLPFNYNGRISRFDRDYFTHRSDRRKRFLEEDWELWLERLILAKTLARRISMMLENLGEFSVDFDTIR